MTDRGPGPLHSRVNKIQRYIDAQWCAGGSKKYFRPSAHKRLGCASQKKVVTSDGDGVSGWRGRGSGGRPGRVMRARSAGGGAWAPTAPGAAVGRTTPAGRSGGGRRRGSRIKLARSVHSTHPPINRTPPPPPPEGRGCRTPRRGLGGACRRWSAAGTPGAGRMHEIPVAGRRNDVDVIPEGPRPRWFVLCKGIRVREYQIYIKYTYSYLFTSNKYKRENILHKIRTSTANTGCK